MKKPCPDCVELEKRVKALEGAVAGLAHRTSDMVPIGPEPWDYAVEGVEPLVPLTEDEIKEIQQALDGHAFWGMK